MGAKLPGMGNDRFAYALYLLSGMLGWSLFADVVTRCLTLFIDNATLMKKMILKAVQRFGILRLMALVFSRETVFVCVK